MPDLSPSLATAFADANQSQSVLNVCDAFNARCDSARMTLKIGTQFQRVPNTPKAGVGIVLVDGASDEQAAGIFIACKVAGGDGEVNPLMQVAGSGPRAGESYEFQWLADNYLEVKTTGAPQTCFLRWRT